MGSALRLRVTAANAGGESSADSAPTPVVVGASATKLRNLVPGGAFEQPPGRLFARLGEATFSWASDRYRSPSHSLKISSPAGKPARWVTRAPARGGMRYTLSVWARTARLHGRVQVALTFWTASGAYRGTAVASEGPIADWRRLSVSRVAPPGTASVRVELRQTGAGTSWWDDLTLTDGRTGY